MHRSLCAVALSIAAFGLVPAGASATGPGGWDHLGTGATPTTPALNGAVSAMAVANGHLYVGGDFTHAGSDPATRRIATWDGHAWDTLGSGIDNGIVLAIAVDAGGNVYAGGTFVNEGGDPKASHLVTWDGTAWRPFCNRIDALDASAFNGNVTALQIIGNRLYVGGEFSNGAGRPSADGLLACDLGSGASTSILRFDDGPGYAVYALAADSNGTLYAGGPFSDLDGISNADHVAVYAGTGWTGLGQGLQGVVTGIVRSLTATGTDLYVGADQTDIAGIPQADHLARWDGTAWSAVGSDTAGTNGWLTTAYHINAMTTLGQGLFVTGSFADANGIATADNVAYFDGSSWHPLGSNGAGDGALNRNGEAIAVMRGRLYVGGGFTAGGGDRLASAAASYLLLRPDARIRSGSSPWVGNDIYSATAARERVTIPVERQGSAGTFAVTVQNDGIVPDVLGLHAIGRATGYSVRYFSGTTDVTAAVRAGTYRTPILAPGAKYRIHASVRLAATAADTATFLIKASSLRGVPVDAVKVVVRAQ
jgi:hypothetical protein